MARESKMHYKGTMEIIVTKPKTEDEIKAFESQVYEYISLPDNWPRDDFYFPPETEAIIRKFLFKEAKTGNIIGTGAVRLIGPGMARVSYVSIVKDKQRQGLGRLMMQLLEITAFKLGASTIQLSSAHGKEPFYMKIGYKIIGKETAECHGKVDVANLMEKHIYRTKL